MESKKVVDSGVQPRKKRKARKRKRTMIRSKIQMLVPEMEGRAGEHDLKPEKSGSPLLEKVGNLFGLMREAKTEAEDQAAGLPTLPHSGSVPESSSQTSSSATLSVEAEEALRRVPSVIGEEPIGDELEDGGEFGADEIRGLLDAVAFEEQDVKDTLEESFEWLSEYFGSDHWKLTPRQVRMLGRPTAQLLNSIWAKLKDKLPDILARWCESTPGATAFLMACGLVVVPKGLKQWKLSRAKREIPSEQPKPKPAPSERPAFIAPQPQRRPPQNVPQESIAPVATGIVGGN